MRKKRKNGALLRGLIVLVLFAVVVGMIVKVTDLIRERKQPVSTTSINQPDFTVDLLTVNAYSRPGTATDPINGIVIHYTANPGTTAKQNRDYFEGLRFSRVTKVSAHFIIGLEGEIIQCVPTGEIAYASNDRNHDTISIETCHPDETGQYTEETYDSLVELTAWLCGKFQLDEDDVIRHYDVTGKACPLYFVDHEDAWEDFKNDVGKQMKKYGE